MIIVKNPGIGFTIEGGIDSQKTVGDTYDTVRNKKKKDKNFDQFGFKINFNLSEYLRSRSS